MTNETVFYAAVSSDGFLAGTHGDMTWAEKWLSDGDDYGYFKLVSSCSAMLMGSKTFDFELAAIGNQDRILPTYVLTTNPQRYDGVHGDVKLVAGDVSAVVDRITDAHPGGRLFVVGGADVARQLLEANKLDVVVLTTTPDVLQVGLKLWAADSWREEFELVAREEFASGLVQETWRRKPAV
jgi:dihydrofolate reductase